MKKCEMGTQTLWQEKQEGSSEPSPWYVCLCRPDDWLRPRSRNISSIFNGVLVTLRALLPRKRASQRSFTFLLIRERNRALTSNASKPFEHHAIPLQRSCVFVLCEQGRGDHNSYLLLESVQRIPKVFQKEGVLSGDPASSRVSVQRCFKDVWTVAPDPAPVKGEEAAFPLLGTRDYHIGTLPSLNTSLKCALFVRKQQGI